MKQNLFTKIVSLFTTLSPKQYMLGFYHSTLLNERNIEYYPYPKYWVYDNIYLNLLTLENMKGSVINRYEKILKPLISGIVIGALSLTINIDKNVLANDIANTCKYDSASKVNPDYSTMNCLLTETALSYNVPPEIVKAIAEGESGNWRHFDMNGKAIVTADNGIGIMQITNQADYNQDRLKSDIVYNIRAGVETLDDMFKRKDLPSINGGKRDILEHWYFAIMAYNGTKPVNSPFVQATGERNANAYQEKILRIIERLELIDLTELPFTREHFQYDSNSRENIKFSAMNYDFDLPLTKSKYFLKQIKKLMQQLM